MSGTLQVIEPKIIELFFNSGTSFFFITSLPRVCASFDQRVSEIQCQHRVYQLPSFQKECSISKIPAFDNTTLFRKIVQRFYRYNLKCGSESEKQHASKNLSIVTWILSKNAAVLNIHTPRNALPTVTIVPHRIMLTHSNISISDSTTTNDTIPVGI